MNRDLTGLARRLGRRRLADRVATAERALGIPAGGDALARLEQLADRFAVVDDSDAWLILSVLTGQLPTSEFLVETRRKATLHGAVSALADAARRTRGVRRRPLPTVIGQPLIVADGGSVEWRRGALVRGGAVLVPWRGSVVLTAPSADHAARMAAAARFSRSTFIAVADGTGAMTEPSAAPGFASVLSTLSWFHHVVTPSEAAAADMRGWASMLGGVGRTGPGVVVVHPSPADTESWLALVAQLRPAS